MKLFFKKSKLNVVTAPCDYFEHSYMSNLKTDNI